MIKISEIKRGRSTYHYNRSEISVGHIERENEVGREGERDRDIAVPSYSEFNISSSKTPQQVETIRGTC